jgi:gamma-glutamyltranspeptidase/glutathione hydrolase
MNRTRASSLAAILLACAAPFALAQAQQQGPPADSAAGEQQHPEWPAQAVRGSKAMIVSDEKLACEAGIEILKRGGNAVDAAVAVGFALAVVEPAAGNLGGGGFMLVRMADGRAGFVDYRETAPARASRDMYIRADGTLDTEGPTIGYRSVAIPASVAGFDLALRTYGTMKLADVMAPAIRLAEEGFPVSEKLARSLRASRPNLQRFSVSRRIFLKDGEFYQPGEIFRQPELAETLRRIARGGTAEFYRGKLAHEIADEITRMGGLISEQDLATFQPKIREPLRAKYKSNGTDWEVISSPPPSSGGIAAIEALNILDGVDLGRGDTLNSIHWIVETMRRVFADRSAYLADPDFIHVPVRGLTDPRYAAELRAGIDPARATASAQLRAGNPAPFDGSSASGAPPDPPEPQYIPEGDHTTHFSVVDAAGNAVANTYTINNSYGSGVAVSAGFLLNDTMDDFTTQPGVPNKLFHLVQSDANSIAPGKRPLSSMTPTILLRNGELSFVTGSPGGPRIISATLLSMLNWMRFGMDSQADINAPRFHHQWMPDELTLEPSFPAALAQQLAAQGFTIDIKLAWIGQVEAIGIDPKTHERLGAPDPRRQGAAAGY